MKMFPSDIEEMTEPSEEMSYYTEPSDHDPIVVSQMIKRLRLQTYGIVFTHTTN